MAVFHQNVQNFTIVCKSWHTTHECPWDMNVHETLMCLTHVTLEFATWVLNRTLNSCGGLMILKNYENQWKTMFVLNWKIIVHRTQ